jgi:hypothetical protein
MHDWKRSLLSNLQYSNPRKPQNNGSLRAEDYRFRLTTISGTILETCYGNLGVIPGTDAIVRDFYYTHYLAHEWPQIAVIPHLRSLHSE